MGKQMNKPIPKTAIIHDVADINDYTKMREILLAKGHSEDKIVEIMTTHTKKYEEFQKLGIKTKGSVSLACPDPKAVLKLEEKPVETSDHQPCGDCGGTNFLRTGTCHVCQTCGSSAGCS
jgi:hypothetical protein